jgi:hypothetical protein
MYAMVEDSISEMDQGEIEAAGARASQPLPLLDGFEIFDDGAHLVGLGQFQTPGGR